MKPDRTAFCPSISARNSGTFYVFYFRQERFFGVQLRIRDPQRLKRTLFVNQILESNCMLVASRRFDERCGSDFSVHKSITGVIA